MSACALAFLAGLCSTIIGSPTVVDGDTLKFGNQSVRLLGVDAEEMREPNGPRAKEGLRWIVSSSSYIRCEPTGEESHKRVVASCYMADGQDVARVLITQGLALDCARYSGGRYRKYEPIGIRNHLTQKPYCRSKS
jgi:endonuclease YncB( thermonuclease family)